MSVTEWTQGRRSSSLKASEEAVAVIWTRVMVAWTEVVAPQAWHRPSSRSTDVCTQVHTGT